MLKFVRKSATSLLGTLMLGAISLVFILSFGPGANGCQSVNPNQNVAEYVIKLDGKKVGISEYQELRKKVYLQQQQQKSNLSEDQLNGIVLNQLVAQELYLSLAKSLKLTVSDTEKDKYITNTSYFQVNGKFDYTTYKNIVQNYFNTTPIQYEKNIKNDILISKAAEILTSPISISDAKLWEQYKEENKAIDLSFIKFTPKKDAIVAPTEKEVSDYLAANEAAVKKYFESNKDEFTHAKEVEASHILITVDKNKTDADAKKAIEKIAAEIKPESDFAELAKKYSEGPSKTTGGKLGFFTKDKMVKEFSDAAFNLKLNEISKPVKTKFGYHLIKVTGIKEASSDKYEDVKSKIAKNLIEESKTKEATDKLKSLITENLKKSKTIQELLALMPEYKIETAAAIKYNPYSYIPNLGITKDLVSDIFKSDVKEASLLAKVYTINNVLTVAQVDKITLDKEKFEAEKSQFREKVLQADKALFLDAWVKKTREASTLVVHPNYLPKN